MSTIVWRENLSLGIPTIDKDHERLIDALNALRFLDAAGDDGEAIALAEVVQYTQGHFRREEMLMRLGGYPRYEAHRGIHRKIAERVAGLQARFRADPRRFQVQRFYDTLADWLIAHIQEEDMKIKPYVERLDQAHAA